MTGASPYADMTDREVAGFLEGFADGADDELGLILTEAARRLRTYARQDVERQKLPPPIDLDTQLDIAAVAELAGVEPRSILRYRQRGAIPDADGFVGRSPWWWRTTIDAWLATRPSSGRAS